METKINLKGIELDIKVSNYTGIDYISLQEKETEKLSISGSYNGYSGQCYDKIEEVILNDEIKLTDLEKENLLNIISIWKKYHLNDLIAGTKKQIDFLEKNWYPYHSNYDYDDYSKIVRLLNFYNMLIDNGYKYGTGWLIKSIPQNIIDSLEKSIDCLKNQEKYYSDLQEQNEDNVKEEIKNYLVDNIDEVIDVISEINSYNGELEEYYYQYNDEGFFDCYFSSYSPYEVVKEISYNDNYNIDDDYVHYSYGELDSKSESEYYNLIEENLDEIIDSMLDNLVYIRVSDDLQEIIDKLYEDEEE